MRKKIDLTIEEKNITLEADLSRTEEETDLHLWIPIQKQRKAIDKDQIQYKKIKEYVNQEVDQRIKNGRTMMNTTDRRDEIVEAEANNREEDINHHPRMNIHQETIEIIGKEKTEINIGINQMKIRTTTLTILPELIRILDKKTQLQIEYTAKQMPEVIAEHLCILILLCKRLMREEKIILNPKLRPSSKITKA